MTADRDRRKAVIYCRVSSMKQATRGDGLSSQETRCREFAKYKGYSVAEVFKDDLSGSLINRPGMKAMLAFLRKHKNANCVVIIDDISRLARGLEAHLQLRAAIGSAGGTLESPSIEFGEDSDSQLVENLLASVSQHQRQKNGEQTRNRMRARVLNGYWPFSCPVGYEYKRVSGHGNMLVRKEPFASIVQEALEGYASGRFQIRAEVKRFLESFPEYPRDRRGYITNQHVTNLVERAVYAGYVEAPNWGVSRRKGQHEALISFETFQRIQERSAEKAKVPARKNLNLDFPLRGFVVCGHCGNPYTACWSSGRGGRYPYYLCANRRCERYGKSVRREVLEDEFEKVLRRLRPSESLFSVARKMFEDLWNHRLESAQGRALTLKKELEKIMAQVDQFLDRIAATNVPSVAAAYERRIQELEDRKIELTEKIGRCGTPLRSFDETLRTALDFLGEPHKLWRSERIEDKRAVLKLAFADRLAYNGNEGFRTANPSFPFKMLESFSPSNMGMARPEGLEPPTPGLEGRCSIRLSYGRGVGASPVDTLGRLRLPGRGLVGVTGFEPATSCSQSRRATGLRYTPTEAADYSAPGNPCIACGVPARPHGLPGPDGWNRTRNQMPDAWCATIPSRSSTQAAFLAALDPPDLPELAVDVNVRELRTSCRHPPPPRWRSVGRRPDVNDNHHDGGWGLPDFATVRQCSRKRGKHEDYGEALQSPRNPPTARSEPAAVLGHDRCHPERGFALRKWPLDAQARAATAASGARGSHRHFPDHPR